MAAGANRWTRVGRMTGIGTKLTGVFTAFLLVSGCTTSDFGRSVDSGTGFDQRVANFRQDLARNPSDMKALLGLGDAFARRSSWAQASGAYSEALIVDGGNRNAQVGYSVSQSALGRYDQALNHANKAVGQRADTDALVALAIALNGQTRHAEAKQALDQALSISPRDLDVRNNLGLTLALMGDPAGYGVQRAVAMAPDSDFRHHRNFYLVAAMLGRESAAKQDGASLSLSEAEISAVSEIGRKARGQGMRSFGLASKL